MANCQRCGKYCADHYTYCKECYYKLGEPFGMATSRGHKCRKCKITIYGKYNYCMKCAKNKGYLKSDY